MRREFRRNWGWDEVELELRNFFQIRPLPDFRRSRKSSSSNLIITLPVYNAPTNSAAIAAPRGANLHTPISTANTRTSTKTGLRPSTRTPRRSRTPFSLLHPALTTRARATGLRSHPNCFRSRHIQLPEIIFQRCTIVVIRAADERPRARVAGRRDILWQQTAMDMGDH